MKFNSQLEKGFVELLRTTIGPVIFLEVTSTKCFIDLFAKNPESNLKIQKRNLIFEINN